MWGQVYHLAGGSRFQRSRGLNALSPRGPTSLGNSFPLFLPSLPLSLHDCKGILQPLEQSAHAKAP